MRGDALHFQELDLEIDDFIETLPDSVEESDVFDFAIENTALAEYWPSLDSEFVSHSHNARLPIPDVSKWIDASLVLSPKAHRLLKELLEPFGEFLPVTTDDERYFIFNCLTFVDADESQSEKQLYEGEEVGIKSLIFDNASAEGKLIFKCRYQHCLDVFCTERLKNLIEDFGLSGINFDLNLASPFE